MHWINAVLGCREPTNSVQIIPAAKAGSPKGGRTLRDQDDLPRYRVGKMLRFKKSEVDEWMLKHREGGNEELSELVDGVLAKVI